MGACDPSPPRSSVSRGAPAAGWEVLWRHACRAPTWLARPLWGPLLWIPGPAMGIGICNLSQMVLALLGARMGPLSSRNSLTWWAEGLRPGAGRW